MSDQKRLQKNLELLGRITPQVALKLQYVDPSEVQVGTSRSRDPNLCVQANGESVFLHSNYDPVKEAEKWFRGLDLTDINVLFVYGVGLGYYFDAVKPWLDESAGHYLVFIEDDMSVLYRLMETEKGTEILEHKQVQIHVLKDFEADEPMFQWLAWFFVLTNPEVSSLQAYERNKAPIFTQLRAKLMHDSVFTDSIAAEYMRYGRSFYRNFYRNMLSLEHSYHGNHLFGNFRGIPAVICGAGPSLNRNMEVLKSLGDKALIFAGGSSLNALSSQAFLPHFGAGIDPNPPQYERLISNYGYEVPFFYRNRMYFEAFEAIHGPRLYLTGAGGYELSTWFDERLGIEGELIDEGHNVVNFCVEIACRLGCNPIIFVGMDLAYTDMQIYADGVVVNKEVDTDEILKGATPDAAAFPRPDIHGNPVYTLWKWINESQWISEYAEQHPGVRFINATEGGIGFEGIPNLSLAEAKETFLKHSYDFRGWVHGAIQNAAMPQVTTPKVLDLMHEVRQSLHRVVKLTEALVDETEAMEKKVKSGKKVPDTLQSGRAALWESELSEEMGYVQVIALSAQVCNKVLARRLHQIQYDKSLRTETEKNLERLKVNRDKFRFIREAALCNLDVLEEAVRKYAKKGFDVGDFLEREIEAVEL